MPGVNRGMRRQEREEEVGDSASRSSFGPSRRPNRQSRKQVIALATAQQHRAANGGQRARSAY